MILYLRGYKFQVNKNKCLCDLYKEANRGDL